MDVPAVSTREIAVILGRLLASVRGREHMTESELRSMQPDVHDLRHAIADALAEIKMEDRQHV